MGRDIPRRRGGNGIPRSASIEAGITGRQGGGADIATSLRASAMEAVSSSTYNRSRPRVGLDLISVAEVAASLERFGDRYTRRVYTPEEVRYCRSASGAAASARFAARFAAKEAVVKALGPAREWTRWRDIEVRRHRSGRCTLVLHGQAAVLARRRGIRGFSLSLTHDGDHAAAIVLAWRHTQTRLREG
jgi:holo-[acyl-carrier protein] synthase